MKFTQTEKVEKIMSRTSGTYGTIWEGLVLCFIIRYSEVKSKEYCAEKYIWRNSSWELPTSNERHKPVDERGLLNLKQDKPNGIYVHICYNHTVESKTKKNTKTRKTKATNNYEWCGFLIREHGGQKEVNQCFKYAGGLGGAGQSSIGNIL